MLIDGIPSGHETKKYTTTSLFAVPVELRSLGPNVPNADARDTAVKVCQDENDVFRTVFQHSYVYFSAKQTAKSLIGRITRHIVGC
jgi:hypothetical protein